MAQTSPRVFLSHSGADTDSARELKRRLENAPDARAAGLKVWFDKDALRPGAQWQPQIEKAIGAEVGAFVVYVGSRGVMNWVEAEVRIALSRATTDKDFLFIPVLAAERGANALPPFARLYQAVHDPLGNGEELAKLLKAVLKADWDRSTRLIDEPFVGLRSMREEEADRFFGRTAEIRELVEKFRRHRIVAIVADSGTGKSSLAAAGFASAFRGGALADPARYKPDDRIWHVVTMRPGANPEEGLRTGVTEAAEKLGRSGDERASLRRRVAIADPGETAYALQCDLPAKKAATLIIVDQFEELFTATPDALAAAFVGLLLALADGDKGVRVLLTVRADYFNVLSDIKDGAGQAVRCAGGKTLFERLGAENGDAILQLKRISPAGLGEAVRKPLSLAGETDEAAAAALLEAVRQDISDQPSDLPLMQVALRAAWQEHKATDRPMLEAYQSVGGVRRALANEAERIRNALPAEDKARLESIFVRLVRLGDAGGATRRTAALDEFDGPRRELLQRLGDEDHGHLVAVRQESAEIAHEALIIQWPWLRSRLREDADDVHRLDRLMSRTSEWSEAPAERKGDYLATGAERETFDELAKRRAGWLSRVEPEFIAASNNKEWWSKLFRRSAVALLALGFVLVVGLLLWANSSRLALRSEVEVAGRNLSVALTALAVTEATKHPVNAAKLALAAWPRENGDKTTPKLLATLDALSQIVPNLRERQIIKGFALSAVFSPDGTRIVVTSLDKTAGIWDAASGSVIATLKGHEGPVLSAAFSPDGTRVVTASRDNTARLWDTASGRELIALKGHKGPVVSAAFSPDGTRVVTASNDGTARLWDRITGGELATLDGHEGPLVSAAFSPDGTRIVTASDDGTVRSWDAASGRATAILKGHEGSVRSAAFSPDGTRIVTASDDGIARLWDSASASLVATLAGDAGRVLSVAFSSDGRRIVTASVDSTARVWDAHSGSFIALLAGHEGPVTSAAFSPDGTNIVTSSVDSTVRVWDAISATVVGMLAGQHTDSIGSAAFSPDGKRIVTGSADKTARVWDAASGSVIATLEGHDAAVWSAAFSPDGKRIVTASFDKTARVWDAASARTIIRLVGHKMEVVSVAFSPDGTRVATASWDGTARVWNAASGSAIIIPAGMQPAALSPDGKGIRLASVQSVAFSPDGTRIVTASADTARVWDAASGRAIATLKGHEGPVWSAAFSPDGKRIVTASYDKTARVWDAASGSAIATLKGHEGPVWSAAFSPDGTRIVTASDDKTARLWDVATGSVIAALAGHSERVNSAAFSPDGTRVVAASNDKTARVWDVGGIPKGDVLQVACKLLNGNFSLKGVTAYPLTFDRPICAVDPPPPDLIAEPPAPASAAK
jgi:WD40 repeat protein